MLSWLAGLLLLAPPQDVHADDVHRLVVLNKSDDTLVTIDPATGAIEHTVPTGAGPHEVVVTRDGRTAIVADYGHVEPGRTLTVIDLVAGGVVRTVDLGEHRRPHGIQLLDGERTAIVTTEDSQSLVVVDIVRGEVLEAIGTEQYISHMVAATPDGRRAFVANIGSGSTSVIDLQAGTLTKVLETGKGAEAVDVTPDGSECWIGNREDDTLTVIDVETLEVRAELPCAVFPIRLKFTPDGKHALVSNAHTADVAVFDVAERKELRRIPMKVAKAADQEGRLFGDRFGESPVPVGIQLDPRGQRAYVANTQADLVTVIDLRSWTVIDRWTTGKEPDGMAWSLRRAERTD